MERRIKNFVEISHLSFKHLDRVIFKNLNICVPVGKIVAIMGPSGIGKTTLLRLISAQLYPTKGKILVDGVDIHKLKRKKLYEARRNIGLLFQSGALFTNLSVFENVAFALREHTKLPEDLLRDLVLMQLEAVGLRGAQKFMPSELSGGMAHRVALARAMVLDPKLMMYDEPFAGQDPITMSVLIKLIKKINDSLGLTSIIISHDVAETASIADYIYIIGDGAIAGEGTPQEIMSNNDPWVKQFVHGLADGIVSFHYPSVPYKEDLGL